MLKTIFWGNSDFVPPVLQALKDETHLKAIMTGPDQPFGRRLEQVKIPEPKELGLAWGIPVYQPLSLKDPEMTNLIRKMEPDLMVVISYGKIIPEAIYSIPPLGTINLHASLLPRYRGASPIQQSLLNGDSKTGISIQKINHRLDEGNLLLSKEIAIEQEDHYVSLRKKLSELSAEILKEYLDALKQGKSLPEFPQAGEPSFCRKITREQGLIRWHEQSAEEVVNQWRALMLWPGVYTHYQQKTLKLSGLSAHEWQGGKPGEVLLAHRKEGLFIKAKTGAVKILEIQPENKKNMGFSDFLNGHPLKTGDYLS